MINGYFFPLVEHSCVTMLFFSVLPELRFSCMSASTSTAIQTSVYILFSTSLLVLNIQVF